MRPLEAMVFTFVIMATVVRPFRNA
jgi:hypothetical protein